MFPAPTLRHVFVSLVFVACIGVSVNNIPTLTMRDANADGLDTELLPPVLVDGRHLALSTKLLPSYIVEGENSTISLQLRLFDSLDNNTIQNVTYVVIIGKYDPEADRGVRVLLNEAFYSEKGPLTVNFVPATSGDFEAGTVKSGPLDAWVANGVHSVVNYKTSSVLTGGLYHIGVVIASFEDPNSIFSPERAPSFLAGLSIGYAKESTFDYLGRAENITIVSFYDIINDFDFDQSSNTFSWSMPFNWNMEEITSKNILVHHEFKIPKSLFPAENISGIVGSVNGEELSGRNLALDPYSSDKYLTVHYILSKQDLLSMSKQIDSLINKDMEFRLNIGSSQSIGAEEGNYDGNVDTTETVLITERSGIQATIQWNPNKLGAEKPIEMTITFSDALADSPIDDDVNYDLTILDLNGNKLVSKSGLVAISGLDFQDVIFPTNERYYIELTVNGFVLYPADNEDGSLSLDTTRAGIARAIVIVPEFPYQLGLLVMGALLSLSIVISRILMKFIIS